ncbi:amino acid adenylation domain-containing protein [Streptosporangium sp. KLBMP 9127]|nr:amino acid adenylation domain-containing protein [Streptosporangium sp. KLBMP 9127]
MWPVRGTDGSRTVNALAHLVCHLPFDGARFRRAVSLTAVRHPALRSRFDLLPGHEPRQVVDAVAEIGPAIADLRGLADPRTELRRWIRAEAAKPFELSRAPLVRLSGHRLTEDEFHIVLVAHSALLDRHSLPRIFSDLLTAYHASPAHGEPDPAAPASPPPAFTTPSPDAAAVQEWAATFHEITAAPPQHWIAPAQEEPVEKGESDRSGSVPPQIEAELPPELVGGLQQAGERHNVSIADILLTVHGKAVALSTGRSSVAIELEADLHQLDVPRPVGMLTATLPVLIALPSSWQAAVDQVRETRRAALAAAFSPVRLQRIRDVEQVPDATFVYSTWSLEADLLDGARGAITPLATTRTERSSRPAPTAEIGHAHLPFSGTIAAEFFHATAQGRILLRITAAPGLTSGQLGEVMRLHLEALRHYLSSDDDHKPLPALTAAQRDLTLTRWNLHPRPYDLDRPVHELFEEQVRRTPHATAVTDGQVTLTFDELNARANRLARHLRTYDVGVGGTVGVYTTRDANMLVAFLAVIKAGAAYVPLDPHQPAPRTAYMLQDSRALLVLADDRHVGTLPPGPWRILLVDEPAPDAARLPGTNLGRTSDADDLMYVIYTSGSTGRPKGVEVPHRGVANYLQHGIDIYARRGHGGAPVFSSVAFDMVVPNLYIPLLIGERVCILGEDLSLFDIADTLARLAPFTFIKLTPGQLDTFSELIQPAAARRLAGTLVVGADAFSVRALRHWRRLDPETPILNEYGPTEASVGNTVHVVDGSEDGDLIPIGRPIANTTMYVLDEELTPLPIGVPGELYIGGSCVVRGYAHREQLTRERFIPDPFDSRPGARLYRTGDIGRWSPQGVLEFLGRVDDQLKIRGYRVDPAEVEAAIARHPMVAEATVTRVGATRETVALAGYYVPRGAVTPELLRTFLSESLPDYLVPGFLISVAEIPLNSNGKVDRKALPAPGRHQAGSARVRAAAVTARGELAADVWRRVHELAEVTVDTRLTTSDGDLTRDVQVAARLAEEGVLPVEQVLDLIRRSATFGEFAALLDQQGHPSARPGPAGTSPPAHPGTR